MPRQGRSPEDTAGPAHEGPLLTFLGLCPLWAGLAWGKLGGRACTGLHALHHLNRGVGACLAVLCPADLQRSLAVSSPVPPLARPRGHRCSGSLLASRPVSVSLDGPDGTGLAAPLPGGHQGT